MRTWSKYQLITHMILLTLLVANFSNSLLGLIYRRSLGTVAKDIYADKFEFWAILLYGVIYFGSFPVIALVIKLNRDHLQKLNIDKSAVLMLIVAGLIVLYSLPYNCFAGIALIYTIYILFDSKVKFGVPDQNVLRMILLIVTVFTGIMMYLITFDSPVKVNLSQAEPWMRQFLLETIPLSICEEVVYRGMLYMFLKDLGLTEPKAFYTQAFLFWITHINYLPSYPVGFWTISPMVSLTLGYLAYRSKSITPSIIAHILYNTVVQFARFIP